MCLPLYAFKFYCFNMIDVGLCQCPSLRTKGVAPQIFTTALNFFAAAQCLVTEDWPKDSIVENEQQYDFIIVGAGSAGSVVANRLSEVKNWKVLLIEAGGDPPIESTIPYLSDYMFGTKFDWNYKTVNDGYASQAHVNETVSWHRGKMLGGSGAINAMVYFRGNDHDYQEWYNEGNLDWHPDVVRKYFQKAESLQDETLLEDQEISEFYGHDGPLVINTFNSTDEAIMDKVLEAWDEIGIKNVPDMNFANVLGSGIYRVTAADGVRYSPAKAYLISARKRNNLTVMKNTLVTKLLINETSLAAYGVEVDRNGKKITILASLEVIVSAGSINTPQLLMLSGLGSKEHLNDKKIQTIVDLPAVGQNLQDHITIPVPVFVDDTELACPSRLNFDAVKYLYDRKGCLAQTSYPHVSAFYTSDKDGTYPLFQNQLIVYDKNSTSAREFLAEYKSSISESLIEESTSHPVYMFLIHLLHPYSKGNVTLNTANASDPPLIYANYFNDARDLEAAATGIKMLTQIVNTTYFQSIGGYLGRIKWPTCDNFELDSDKYWKCAALNMVATIYHPVGTAKMGLKATNSVVDSHLRVHGVHKLRVIDASVMPTLTSGNTNGPVIMIAERACDLVKADHKAL